MPVIRAERYHDFSCGHRVVGHEGKCRFLHGHNYRVHFVCEAQALDEVGRVVDFSVIKSRLCQWLEDRWDHKTLLWRQDPALMPPEPTAQTACQLDRLVRDSVVIVGFNPTAENIAAHLLEVVAPEVLHDAGVRVVEVRVEETRKCSATARFEAAAAT